MNEIANAVSLYISEVKASRLAELAKAEFAIMKTIEANANRNIANLEYEVAEAIHVEQLRLHAELAEVRTRIQEELNKRDSAPAVVGQI